MEPTKSMCQCLIAPMRTFWLEYDMLGNVIALHDTNTSSTPERLHNALYLPALRIPNREVVYWRAFVKESNSMLFYRQGE